MAGELRKNSYLVEAYNRGKPIMPSIADFINELREERDEQILRSIGFGDFSGDDNE